MKKFIQRFLFCVIQKLLLVCKPIIKVLEMDKTYTQKEFIRVLYDAGVSRKKAIDILMEAFKNGLVKKKITTKLDFKKLSKKSISQHYFLFHRDDLKSDREPAIPTIDTVTMIQSSHDVLVKLEKNKQKVIEDIHEQVQNKIEGVVLEVETKTVKDEVIDVLPSQTTSQKKSFWDL